MTAPGKAAAVGTTSAVLVIVSIDTEEDDWVPTRRDVTVENIRELPRLNRMLRDIGVRPTYFTNHAVAATPWAAEILRDMRADGGIEIGSHLHPWNTPPLEPEWQPRDTMLKNLPASLQHAKLAHLTAVHAEAFDSVPNAFRAGRWGMGPDAMRSLAALGYGIDSSVTPFTDWRSIDDGPDFVGAPLGAYRHDGGGDLRTPVPNGPVLEIPASFGYNRAPFHVWHKVHAALMRGWSRRLRLPGVCHHTGILRKLTLSPETDSVRDMLTLSRLLIEHGARYLHPFWHSPSACPGLSPFVATRADADRFPASIARYFEGLSKIAPLRFVTISEAACLLDPSPTRVATTSTIGPAAARPTSVEASHGR
jgi:hypothetical protein